MGLGRLYILPYIPLIQSYLVVVSGTQISCLFRVILLYLCEYGRNEWFDISLAQYEYIIQFTPYSIIIATIYRIFYTSLLCSLKYGIILYNVGWITILYFLSQYLFSDFKVCPLSSILIFSIIYALTTH